MPKTSTTPLDAPIRRSARERLLAAAEALFYEEGFNTVGIDRVIERAGVAKASLYDCFGSKEELIRSYLAERKIAREARVLKGLDRFGTARDRLLGIFDLLGESIREPTFRGCAFIRAGSDLPASSTVKSVCDESRQWMHDLLVRLARDAGAKHPKVLAGQLAMLYDGASVAAQLDRETGAARAAKLAAAALLDSDLASGA